MRKGVGLFVLISHQNRVTDRIDFFAQRLLEGRRMAGIGYFLSRKSFGELILLLRLENFHRPSRGGKLLVKKYSCHNI